MDKMKVETKPIPQEGVDVLRIQGIGPLFFYPHVSSTMDIAHLWGKHGLSQAWVVALSQEKGRGQRAKHWHSPLGNLYLSFMWQEDPCAVRSSLSYLPLKAALAIGQALEWLMGKSFPYVFKWPNDLWVGDKKIAGVLCERDKTERYQWAVVGVGLNIKKAFLRNSTCLEEWGYIQGYSQALGAVMWCMQSLLGRTYDPREKWLKRGSAHLYELEGSFPLWGRAVGLSEQGYLILSTSQGPRTIVSSAHVKTFLPLDTERTHLR